jgi:hypothetical protein
MHIVEIITTKDCHLCDEAKAILARVNRDLPFTLVETRFSPTTHEQIRNDIPVVYVDGRFFAKHRIDERILRRGLTP